MDMLFNLSSIILREAFKPHRRLLIGLLAHYPIELSLLFGRYSQRAVEYPWVIKNLGMVPKGGLILDVGCAESLLSQEFVRLLKHEGILILTTPFERVYKKGI